jgi:uncharacterized protein DUF4367
VGQHNIIELNGKQYDAITGALLGESRVKAIPAGNAVRAHRGRSVDGFMRSNKAAHQPVPTVIKPSPVTVTNHVNKQPTAAKKPDIQRAPKAIRAHQPERPKTLMRHAVRKPNTTIKPAIKTTAPTEMMARPTASLTKPLEKKLSVTQVNPVRLARARHVSKSHHIRRFSQARHPANALDVRHPAQQVTRPVVPQRTAAQTRNASPSQALAAARQQLANRQKNTDIFEAALAHAVSHEQLPHKKTKRRGAHRRLVNIVAGVAAFLIIGGFITYLNMPAIELQVASVRAGFRADMPSYQPTGYALDGGVKSSKGKVAMSFRSGDSSYKITQEVSDWNSATLLDQKTEEQGAPMQTIQSKGRIIYIYDDNNATWVNGGVRYEISGNASLDADELVSVATSM